MASRSCTWDLREGLGLYRWGDTRPEVQELFADAIYDVHTNVYAFQRTFLVAGLFGDGVGPPLGDVDAYLDPLAPEIVFDHVPAGAACALLERVGWDGPLAAEGDDDADVERAIADAKVTVTWSRDGEVWLKIEGPSSSAPELDDDFGPANQTD
jgi:hypothetical protein